MIAAEKRNLVYEPQPAHPGYRALTRNGQQKPQRGDIPIAPAGRDKSGRSFTIPTLTMMHLRCIVYIAPAVLL